MSETFYTIVAIIFGTLGVLLGAALALMITVWFVKRSNDVGDSSGTMYDFRATVNLFDDSDNVYNSDEKRSEEIFRKHLKAAMEEASEREEKRKKNPYAGLPRRSSQR